MLNDTVHKFDALRAKYIGAFIDSMKLCKRRDVLETFLGWIKASQRDLPAFYEASASSKGGMPQCWHGKEIFYQGSGLLWAAKRHTNSAISEIIMQELECTFCDLPKERKEERLKELLKSSFVCFLRLNCPICDDYWKSGKKGVFDVLEVKAICKAYLSLYNEEEETEGLTQSPDVDTLTTMKHWLTLLRKAVSKCEDIFPAVLHRRKRKKCGKSTVGVDFDKTHIGTSFDKEDYVLQRKNAKQKEDGAGNGREPADKNVSTSKKKNAGKETVSKKKIKTKMVVALVPKGLVKGDRFEVKINIGTLTKKVTLTVPEGNPLKLKFPFKIPKESRGHTLKGSDMRGNEDTTEKSKGAAS